MTYPSYLPFFPRAWRHNRVLVNASVALHVCTALAAIPQVVSLLWLRGRVDAFRDGTITGDQLTDATNRYFLLAGLPGLITAANTIVLIVLLWRLARNHEAIGRPNTTFGPVWAIVGPLVPLLNMAVPWLQINEQWKGCDPEHPPADPQWKSARGSSMVYGWWAVSLASVIIGLAATAGVARAMFSSFGAISKHGDLVEVAQDLVDNNLKLFVASTLLAGVAAILGAVTLRALVARQDRYAEQFKLDHATTMPAQLGSQASPFAAAPGWFPDPAGRFDHRWWDGTQWTETVSRDGSTTTDAL